MVKISFHPDRQTFPSVFVDHIEDPKSASIVGSFRREIIAPGMIREFRPQPYTGTHLWATLEALVCDFSVLQISHFDGDWQEVQILIRHG